MPVIRAVLVLALVLEAGPLQAQDVPRNLSVLERPRPEVDPLNIRVGSFIIAPRLNLGATYNDNIFATESDTESDFIATVAPSVSVRTNWGRNGLSFSAQAVDRRYLENERENTTAYGAELEGTLDVTDQSSLFGSIDFDHRFEERTDPDETDSLEPTPIDVLSLTAGGVQEFNRLAVRITGGFDSVDYDNARAADGSFINNDARDFVRYAAATRLGYLVRPGVRPFIEAAYDVRRHDDDPSRDSKGYRARFGTTLDFTGVSAGSPGNFTGEVFVGFFKQNYDDPAFRDPSGLDLGGSALWNVTGLTSIRLLAERSVEETRTTGVSSFVQTTYGASVEHELLRNLLLQGGVAFITNDFQGGNRDQKDLSLDLRALYLANRNLTLSAAYEYRQRAAELQGRDFTINAISLILQLKF